MREIIKEAMRIAINEYLADKKEELFEYPSITLSRLEKVLNSYDLFIGENP